MIHFPDILGLHAAELLWYQMAVRAVLVFFLALLFIRLSGMRTFGRQSPFDMVVYITLGGMLSKAIMGHYPFFTSLLACGVLVLLHRLLAFLSARIKMMNTLTEGDPVQLYANGLEKIGVLKRYDITHKDLLVSLRENGLDSFEKVKSIWLEPDGTISIVRKSQ